MQNKLFSISRQSLIYLSLTRTQDYWYTLDSNSNTVLTWEMEWGWPGALPVGISAENSGNQAE